MIYPFFQSDIGKMLFHWRRTKTGKKWGLGNIKISFVGQREKKHLDERGMSGQRIVRNT